MGQKEIPEPNLHVCGEDGTQKMVYKLKEEHASGGIGTKKKERKYRLKKKNVKKHKNCIEHQKQNYSCANSGPSIYARVNLFIPQKLI